MALRTRLRTAELVLSELSLTVEAADGEPAEAVAKQLHGKFRRLRPLLDEVQLRLWEVKRQWQRGEQRYPRPAVVADERQAAQVELRARAAGLAAAQQAFAQLAGDQELGSFVGQAQRIVASQHFRAGVARLAGTLLLTVATGGVAGALGAAAARSILLGAEAAELSTAGMTAARLAAGSVSVALNATLNSAVQLALEGGARGRGWIFLENVLMEVATRGLARGLAKPLSELHALEQQALIDLHRMRELAAAERAAARAGRELPLAQQLERGALVTAQGERAGWFAAQLSLEVVMGMASQWAAQRLLQTVRGGGAQVEEDLALAVLQQGAGVMLGKRLASLASAWHARKAELDGRPGFAALPAARELVARRARFFEEAAQLAENLSPERTAGQRLLAEHAELVRQERRVERALGGEPSPPGGGEARGGDTARRPLGLFGDDTRALASALRLPPLPGYLDVFVHGDAENFFVVRKDREVALTAHQLHVYLRKQGVAGRKLRLVACSSGKNVGGIAQRFADAYGREVLAPTDDVWVLPSGERGIGPSPGVRSGEWVPVHPRKKAPALQREPSALAQELMLREGEVDLDAPEAVKVPTRDERAAVASASEETLARLGRELGAPVVRSAQLEDGVQVMVRRVPKLWGFDLKVTEVRVGERSLIGDVRLHRATIEEVERYNGVVGNLREAAHRLLPRSEPPRAGRYPRGSRGHLAELELRKLDRLLEDRASGLHAAHVDEVTLRREVEFLEGRRAFYEEVLRSIDDTARERGGAILERPDTGEVTREALAHGYRLPGPEEGAQPHWYYYRSSVRHPGQYELALRPSAPVDAPPLRARVVGEEFVGLVAQEPRSAEVPHDWTPVSAVAHLRKTPGFSEYLTMLERVGVASRPLIDGVIRQRFNLLGLGEKRRLTADLRRDVREHFRERLLAYLCDPALDAKASWDRLRQVVADLAPTDRGELAEAWAVARSAPAAQRNVRMDVLRQSGDNAGKLERRVVDAVDGRTAIEVKDVTGPIDRDQLAAYLDMLQRREDGGEPMFDKVKYVFTNPKGALANLELFAHTMESRELRGRIVVGVFDERGELHTIATPAKAREMLHRMKTEM